MRKPDVIGLYTTIPCNGGSISESALGDGSALFTSPPPPHLAISFRSSRRSLVRSQMSQSANLTQMLENRAFQSLHPSPLSSDSLITLVFLPSNDSGRHSLSSRILRIGLASPQDRSGVLKVTFRHGVVGPARRVGFIR